MKKAIVFDNSGTLLERYRVIKDIANNSIFTDVNSLDLIDSNSSLALVVLQMNASVLSSLNQDYLISNLIRDNDIEFDVSFTTKDISKSELKEIIYNEKIATIKDITDGFDTLHEKIPQMELCNGSALIIDIDKKVISYTITSAGRLFPEVLSTVEELKNRGIELFIASGDRKGAISRLACMLNINENNAFGTVSTAQKCEIVSDLQSKGYKVMMFGDGLNDLLAFKKADVSVLTLEQKEEVSPKLYNKTDFVVEDISQILDITF